MPRTEEQKKLRAEKRKQKRQAMKEKVSITDGKGNTIQVSKAQIARGARTLRVAKNNPVTGIHGHGDYDLPTVLKNVAGSFVDNTPSKGFVNSVARAGATKLGDMLIPGLGEHLGNAASSLSRWLGFGDYALQANSFLNTSVQGPRPNFGDRPGELRIQWTEYVQDISVTGSTFNLVNFLINPGNSILFPFLAPIALNFEEYEFHGLILHFLSNSSVAFSGNSPAVGSVTMATDYDVYDTNYQNLRQMEIAQFSTTTPPYTDNYHAIECARDKSVLTKMYVSPYTQISQVPDDARFSFLGNFQLATSGIPVSSGAPVIGKLYVTYDVTLRKPQINSENLNISYVQHARAIQLGGGSWGTYSNAFLYPPSFTGISITGAGTGSASYLTAVFGPNISTGEYIVAAFGRTSAASTLTAPGAVGAIVANGATLLNIQSSPSGLASATDCGIANTGVGAYSYAIVNVNNVSVGQAVSLPVQTSNQPMYWDIYLISLPLLFTGVRRSKDARALMLEQHEHTLQELIAQVSALSLNLTSSSSSKDEAVAFHVEDGQLI